MFRFLLWGFLILLLALACLGWVWLRPKFFARRVQRALREFDRNRDALENEFFKKAAATGIPRGLAWKSIAFQKQLLLARDRANGELVGLVAATIAFEAIEGGGMEDVEAVGNLRAGTAVFTWNGAGWTTAGNVKFNLEPRDVIERYRQSLDRVSP